MVRRAPVSFLLIYGEHYSNNVLPAAAAFPRTFRQASVHTQKRTTVGKKRPPQAEAEEAQARTGHGRALQHSHQHRHPEWAPRTGGIGGAVPWVSHLSPLRHSMSVDCQF